MPLNKMFHAKFKNKFDWSSQCVPIYFQKLLQIKFKFN